MSDPLITIDEAGPTGMVTLRADLADPAVLAAFEIAGIVVPKPGEADASSGLEVLWMSPDEVLILTSPEEAEAVISSLQDAFRGVHHLAVNVSDARVMFELRGEDALLREVFAKLTPADLRAASLPVGTLRRTRLAQVPAAFWFPRDGAANLIAFRSVRDYVHALLTKVSEPGSAVGYFNQRKG